MSQFYASIHGSRGQATRQGTKNSGMEGHVRGWNVGAKVVMSYDEKEEEDVCAIYLTSGSTGRHPSQQLIGHFKASDIKEEEK